LILLRTASSSAAFKTEVQRISRAWLPKVD